MKRTIVDALHSGIKLPKIVPTNAMETSVDFFVKLIMEKMNDDYIRYAG